MGRLNKSIIFTVHYLLHLHAYFTTIPRISIVGTKYLSLDWVPGSGYNNAHTMCYQSSRNCFNLSVSVLIRGYGLLLSRRRLNKKLSYCWETVRRESMPRIADVDVEMTI